MFRFSEFCRICLSKSNQLIYLKSMDEDNLRINEKIIFINPDLIPLGDQLPNWVCVICKNQITDAYNLLEKALMSYSILERLLNQVVLTTGFDSDDLFIKNDESNEDKLVIDQLHKQQEDISVQNTSEVFSNQLQIPNQSPNLRDSTNQVQFSKQLPLNQLQPSNLVHSPNQLQSSNLVHSPNQLQISNELELTRQSQSPDLLYSSDQLQSSNQLQFPNEPQISNQLGLTPNQLQSPNQVSCPSQLQSQSSDLRQSPNQLQITNELALTPNGQQTSNQLSSKDQSQSSNQLRLPNQLQSQSPDQVHSINHLQSPDKQQSSNLIHSPNQQQSSNLLNSPNQHQSSSLLDSQTSEQESLNQRQYHQNQFPAFDPDVSPKCSLKLQIMSNIELQKSSLPYNHEEPIVNSVSEPVIDHKIPQGCDELKSNKQIGNNLLYNQLQHVQRRKPISVLYNLKNGRICRLSQNADKPKALELKSNQLLLNESISNRENSSPTSLNPVCRKKPISSPLRSLKDLKNHPKLHTIRYNQTMKSKIKNHDFDITDVNKKLHKQLEKAKRDLNKVKKNFDRIDQVENDLESITKNAKTVTNRDFDKIQTAPFCEERISGFMSIGDLKIHRKREYDKFYTSKTSN